MADPIEHALLAAQLPGDAARLIGPPTPDAPAPPEGPWLVVPYDTAYVVGAMGRGRFAAYASVATIEDAAALVVRLVGEAAATAPPESPEVLQQRAEATRAGILRRTADRGGAAGTAMVAPGEAVDVFGPETGHHLYALGTPFPERSQPPSDAAGLYHRYVVVTALPEATEGVAAPWFGQPGGGAMVVLSKPIRWYVDQGHLVEIPGADGE